MDKRKKSKKKRTRNRRSLDFAVYPLAKVNLGHPPRIAMVYWGKGRPKEYRLDFLDLHEVKAFWQMSRVDMAKYLKIFFNRHHRKPRCQKGPTEPLNLSYVDAFSHTNYNWLIGIVARWSNFSSVEEVRTIHNEQFLKQFYPTLERMFTHNGKIRSLESVLEIKNMECLSQHLIGNIAKWAHVDYKHLHISNVHLFFERIYPPLRRLAYDHQHRKLKSLYSFSKILNEVWFPRDEQMNIHH